MLIIKRLIEKLLISYVYPSSKFLTDVLRLKISKRTIWAKNKTYSEKALPKGNKKETVRLSFWR